MTQILSMLTTTDEQKKIVLLTIVAYMALL